VSRDGGQALVEFALVLPLLLVFAFGILLMAEIGVARVTLEHAASEGARIGALTNDDGAIKRAVEAGLAPLDRARVAVRISPTQSELPRSADPRGTLLRVDLDYAVPVPLAFAGLPRVAVTGHAARIVEWKP
jgi:Flp pilus assembly protein TadG